MGSFPSGGISYAFGSSILEDDEDIELQADKRANAPMQTVQKIKVRKRSEFIALFPIVKPFSRCLKAVTNLTPLTRGNSSPYFIKNIVYSNLISYFPPGEYPVNCLKTTGCENEIM